MYYHEPQGKNVSKFPINHSWCVARLAHALARRIGLPDPDAKATRAAAFFHDLGKIGIPSVILYKPGPLEKCEWDVIHTHPLIGTRIAQAIRPLSRYSSFILSHHERWDGDGYPNGLKGSQIPIASQIIAIADAFHAMTSHRPYRRALDIREALEKVQDGSGTQWSEPLAAALIHMVQRKAAASSKARGSMKWNGSYSFSTLSTKSYPFCSVGRL